MRSFRPLLLAPAVLLIANGARAEDEWLGRDKALHFSVSAGLAAGGYAASALVFEKRWQRVVSGAGFALSLGVAKELYDLSGHGDASEKDLAWDLVGTAVGVSVAWLVDLAISRASAENRRDGALLRF